jgi:hypothetical protein
VKTIRHIGKGGAQEVLPSRSALTRLVSGDPAQRTLGQYAKATPADLSGVNQKKLRPAR